MDAMSVAAYNEARLARAQVWVSGMTVQQWQSVISPLDREIYRRITATGVGITDPADDITNYIAVSYVRSTALPLRQSAWVGNTSQSSGAYYASGIVKTSLEVIATGVRTSILSLTGRGGVGFLGLFLPNSTAPTLRVEAICDNRHIYDSTDAAALNSTRTFLGNTFPGIPPGTSSSTQEGFGSPDTNGPRFRRSFQVFLTPTVGTLKSGSALAASYWSES